MRRCYIVGVAIITLALIGVSLFPPSRYLVWNRTESAPKGLYWRSDSPLTVNGWAVVSGKAPSSIWIAEQGFLAAEWPVIKQVRGLPGDEICRHGTSLFVNGGPVAEALVRDSIGRKLPRWSGCFTLSKNEVFLMNDHLYSLDGRYFAATNREDVTGSARLLIEIN